MMPELQVVMALGFVKPKSFLVVYLVVGGCYPCRS